MIAISINFSVCWYKFICGIYIPCIINPLENDQRTGKMPNFQKFYEVRHMTKFSIVDTEIHRTDMQIINIFRRIVSLHTIRDYNFKFELKWFVRSNFGVVTLKKLIFKLKVLELKTNQQLLGMTSIYLRKTCVKFSRTALLKLHWKYCFLFESYIGNCKGSLFFEKFPLKCVMIGCFPYFLSNTLKNVYSYPSKNT